MATSPNELVLDHAFWEAIATDPLFRAWVVSRSKFAERTLSLILDEKWHQRWYRDPETKKDSETDILLMFRDLDSGDRYALHIENKPDHRSWEPDQPENYRKRAFNRMAAWRYVDFQTVLLAPVSFVARWPVEAAHFDLTMTYEEVGLYVPAFASAVQSPPT